MIGTVNNSTQPEKNKTLHSFYCQLPQKIYKFIKQDLDTKFCSTPLTTFGIVSDCVTCTKADPLWDWSVLAHLFAQLLFGAEGFVGRPVDRGGKSGKRAKEEKKTIRFNAKICGQHICRERVQIRPSI